MIDDHYQLRNVQEHGNNYVLLLYTFKVGVPKVVMCSTYANSAFECV